MSLCPIAELLPHAGDMVLLDAVLDAGDEHIVCIRTVRRDEPFADVDGSLPAWVGIELMAQAVAAWAGWQERRQGRLPKLGFLLGTRQYHCDVDAFAVDSELRVTATRSFHDDNGMGVFACRIDALSGTATANLAVFSPADARDYLSGARESSDG
jgi:predicted hotdog family 3-hydroxylacyl-ACP dehydratase